MPEQTNLKALRDQYLDQIFSFFGGKENLEQQVKISHITTKWIKDKQSLVEAPPMLLADFRFRGCRSMSNCEVVYRPTTDLYRLKIYKVLPSDKRHIKGFFDPLYGDQLIPFFTQTTGLMLRLPTGRRRSC